MYNSVYDHVNICAMCICTYNMCVYKLVRV